jgi:type IV fimbrial biogenesis protein FimT
MDTLVTTVPPKRHSPGPPARSAILTNLIPSVVLFKDSTLPNERTGDLAPGGGNAASRATRDSRNTVGLRKRISFGFTLIEMIVVLTILGITAAVAVPGMTHLIQSERLGTQANDLLADLNYARSEAIRRQKPITVCKSDDPTASAPACDATAANAWTTGRLIFVDDSKDGTHDAGEEMLRVREALSGTSNRLYGDGNTAGTANYVIFLGTGLTTLVPTGGASESQFFLCDSRGPSQALTVVISATGRARVASLGKDMNDSNLTSAQCH